MAVRFGFPSTRKGYPFQHKDHNHSEPGSPGPLPLRGALHHVRALGYPRAAGADGGSRRAAGGVVGPEFGQSHHWDVRSLLNPDVCSTRGCH